jgi:hypothetical protein
MTAPILLPVDTMRVVHCGPAGCPFPEFLDLMTGQSVLYSFWTCRNREWPTTAAEMVGDSGAWHAFQNDVTIDIDALVAWYASRPFTYKFGLDVIGGAEDQQRENQRILESHGLDVVPVFHGPNLEPWSYLTELVERYPIVGLGSTCPDNSSAIAQEWFAQCFDRICDANGRPRTRIHGLRCAHAQLVQTFPFWRVDGSTWAVASKNGRGPTLRGQTDMPWMTTRELQRQWVRFFDYVPKCTTWVPRQLRARLGLPTPSPQTSLFDFIEAV